MMTDKKKFKFEEGMSRLDEIVKLLEKGDAPLDDLLLLYEEGAGLIRQCSKALDEAEQKVTKITRGADGEHTEAPFQTGE